MPIVLPGENVEGLDYVRLRQMCPTGLTDPQLLALSDRRIYPTTITDTGSFTSTLWKRDLHGAAADAWEDYAMGLDPTVQVAGLLTEKQSGSQRVMYKNDYKSLYQHALQRARYHRSRTRAGSVLVGRKDPYPIGYDIEDNNPIVPVS